MSLYAASGLFAYINPLSFKKSFKQRLPQTRTIAIMCPFSSTRIS